jgi:hypothetical protein
MATNEPVSKIVEVMPDQPQVFEKFLEFLPDIAEKTPKLAEALDPLLTPERLELLFKYQHQKRADLLKSNTRDLAVTKGAELLSSGAELLSSIVQGVVKYHDNKHELSKIESQTKQLIKDLDSQIETKQDWLQRSFDDRKWFMDFYKYMILSCHKEGKKEDEKYYQECLNHLMRNPIACPQINCSIQNRDAK